MSTEGTSRLRISADTKDFTAAINTAQNQLAGFSKSALDEYNKLNRAEKNRADSLIRQARALGQTKDQQLIYNASLRGVPTSVLRDVQKNILDVNAANEKAAESAKKLGDFLNGVVKVGTAAAFAYITGTVYAFVKATAAAEKVQAQLSAVLKSTGHAAGWSQGQINKLALSMSSLSGKSMFSPEELTEAATKLLSFTNIVGDQIPRAMQAAADMATREGMDIKQAMETVGRAMDIPSQGYTSLSRQGFKFEEGIKQQLQTLERQGKLFEAQNVLLEAMEGSYEGASEAAARTFGGAIKRLQDTMQDVMTGKGGSLDGMTSAVNDLSNQLGSEETKANIQNFATGLTLIATDALNAFNALNKMVSVIKPHDQRMSSTLQRQMDEIDIKIANLPMTSASNAEYKRLREQQDILRQGLNIWQETGEIKAKLDAAATVEIKPDRDITDPKTGDDSKKSGASRRGESKEAREALRIQQNFIKEMTRMNAQFDAIQAQASNKRQQAMQQFNDELSMFGLGSKAQEQIKEQRGIIDSFQGMFDDLEKATAKAREAAELAGQEFDENPYHEARAFLNEQLELRLQDLKDYYAQVDELEGSYGLGLKQGLADFADQANNVFQGMSNTVKKALDSTADALTEFTMTGKADFKGLANSIIEDLIRIQYQKALTGIFGDGSSGSGVFGSIVGGLFGGGGKVSKFAKGGIPGGTELGSYRNQIVSSPTLFAFAKGGVPNMGLMGEAGGEAIMPLRRGADGSLGVQVVGGGSGGQFVTNISVVVENGSAQSTISGDSTNQQSRALAQVLDVAVKDGITKAMRPGGLLWNMSNGRT